MEVDEGGAYFLPGFDPSEKRRASSSDGGRVKARLGLKSALVGSEGRLSGPGSPTRPPVGKVHLDHGLRSEAMLSIWRAGRSQVRVEFHSIVIGQRAACRPMTGSRHETVVGKLGGTAAAAGLADWAHAIRKAYRKRACFEAEVDGGGASISSDVSSDVV